MPTAIKPKRSTVIGNIPSLADLQDGEIAVNITDQKVYIRNGNVIETIASAATGATPVWNLLSSSAAIVGNKRYLCDTSAGEITLTMPTVGLVPEIVLNCTMQQILGT